MLGAGEHCEYIWDDPRAAHALQLHACDAAGTAMVNSLPSAYKLDRQEKCPELKLEPRLVDPATKFVSPNGARAAS